MTNIPLDTLIQKINIDSDIVKKLERKNIKQIKDLWSLKRNDLKKIGLKDQEIKHIVIKLQLHSIDLNKKIHNKN